MHYELIERVFASFVLTQIEIFISFQRKETDWISLNCSICPDCPSIEFASASTLNRITTSVCPLCGKEISWCPKTKSIIPHKKRKFYKNLRHLLHFSVAKTTSCLVRPFWVIGVTRLPAGATTHPILPHPPLSIPPQLASLHHQVFPSIPQPCCWRTPGVVCPSLHCDFHTHPTPRRHNSLPNIHSLRAKIGNISCFIDQSQILYSWQSVRGLSRSCSATYTSWKL